jgi:hypothetical protein
MLPTRWKIFRIINYVHIFCVVVIELGIGYAFLFLNEAFTGEDLLYLSLCTFCAALFLSNAFMSLHLVEKCYPDKEPVKKFKTASSIVVILSIIVFCLLSVGCILIIGDMLAHPASDPLAYLVALAFCIVACTGLYICPQQITLENFIHNNHQRHLDSFLAETPQ